MLRWLVLPALVSVSAPVLAANRTKAAAAATDGDDKDNDAGADDEVPAASVGLDAEELGPVTYAGLRGDMPLSHRWSIFSTIEMLRVGTTAPAEATQLHGYFGGGLAFRPTDSWNLELALSYGPTAFDIQSLEGSFGVEKDFGADWDHDKPPTIELNLELGVGGFWWQDGLGPAGPEMVQAFLQAKSLFRIGPRVEVTPLGMFFVYDHGFDNPPPGAEVGTLQVLARVGAFSAPLAQGGLKLGVKATSWLKPVIEANEIVYVAGSGDGTELLGGVKLTFREAFGWLIEGGALLNRAHGDLVPVEDQDKSLPIGRTELEIKF